MSVFNLSPVTGQSLNFEAVLNALNSSLPTAYAATMTGNDYATSSATFSDLIAITEDVEADEIVVLIGTVNFSGSVVADKVEFQITADGTRVGKTSTQRIDAVDTTGKANSAAFVVVSDASLSGSIDFALEWRRETGSGTLYTEDETLIIIRLKKRA